MVNKNTRIMHLHKGFGTFDLQLSRFFEII